MNSIAKDMCEQDIGFEELSITQVKKLMRQLADNIAVRPDVALVWNRYVSRRHKILTKVKRK